MTRAMTRAMTRLLFEASGRDADSRASALAARLTPADHQVAL
jgi:hypothetical protein